MITMILIGYGMMINKKEGESYMILNDMMGNKIQYQNTSFNKKFNNQFKSTIDITSSWVGKIAYLNHYGIQGLTKTHYKDIEIEKIIRILKRNKDHLISFVSKKKKGSIYKQFGGQLYGQGVYQPDYELQINQLHKSYKLDINELYTKYSEMEVAHYLRFNSYKTTNINIVRAKNKVLGDIHVTYDNYLLSSSLIKLIKGFTIKDKVIIKGLEVALTNSTTDTKEQQFSDNLINNIIYINSGMFIYDNEVIRFNNPIRILWTDLIKRNYFNDEYLYLVINKQENNEYDIELESEKEYTGGMIISYIQMGLNNQIRRIINDSINFKPLQLTNDLNRLYNINEEFENLLYDYETYIMEEGRNTYSFNFQMLFFMYRYYTYYKEHLEIRNHYQKDWFNINNKNYWDNFHFDLNWFHLKNEFEIMEDKPKYKKVDSTVYTINQINKLDVDMVVIPSLYSIKKIISEFLEDEKNLKVNINDLNKIGKIPGTSTPNQLKLLDVYHIDYKNVEDEFLEDFVLEDKRLTSAYSYPTLTNNNVVGYMDVKEKQNYIFEINNFGEKNIYENSIFDLSIDSGYDEYNNSEEGRLFYQLSTYSYLINSPNTSRYGHGSGDNIIFGGKSNLNNQLLNSIEVYDATTNVWNTNNLLFNRENFEIANDYIFSNENDYRVYNYNRDENIYSIAYNHENSFSKNVAIQNNDYAIIKVESNELRNLHNIWYIDSMGDKYTNINRIYAVFSNINMDSDIKYNRGFMFGNTSGYSVYTPNNNGNIFMFNNIDETYKLNGVSLNNLFIDSSYTKYSSNNEYGEFKNKHNRKEAIITGGYSNKFKMYSLYSFLMLEFNSLGILPICTTGLNYPTVNESGYGQSNNLSVYSGKQTSNIANISQVIRSGIHTDRIYELIDKLESKFRIFRQEFDIKKLKTPEYIKGVSQLIRDKYNITIGGIQ